MSHGIERYYDDFFASRMIGYRIDGNLRLRLAEELVLSFLPQSGVFAEIGCGIGIVSEAIARKRPRAQIIATDISGNNIDYARLTVRRSNVGFFRCDVTTGFEELRRLSPQGYDAVVLIDVIEHIPVAERRGLFANLAGLLRDEAPVILAYPSPEYQRYLIAKDPDELQIVDNVVTLEDLLSEAGEAGFEVRYFTKVDAWLLRQYVHCVLQRPAAHETLPASARRPTLAERARSKVRDLLARGSRPYRVWAYRTRPLKELSIRKQAPSPED